MNYDDFKRPDPVLFLARRNDVVTHGSDKRARVPGEIWQKVASFCDYRTIDAFERAMFPQPENPLLWSHLERPFNTTISAMQPVRPMPAFGRLCRRGLPRETIDRLSLQDAERIAESLFSGCRESFLYLQVNSERYIRPLVQFSSSVNTFLTAAESFHANLSAVGGLREASHEVGLAIARFTLSTMSIKDHQDLDIDMANYEVILKQISAAQAVCKKFYTYRNGEAVRWLQGRPYSTGPRADADLLALKTAAKQLSDLLSVSSRVKSTAA